MTLHLVDDPGWAEVNRIEEAFENAKDVFEYNRVDEELRHAAPEVRALWLERMGEAAGVDLD